MLGALQCWVGKGSVGLQLLLLLVILHMRGEGGGCVVTAVTHGALERFTIVVRLHMDLEVITKLRRKGHNNRHQMVFNNCVLIGLICR